MIDDEALERIARMKARGMVNGFGDFADKLEARHGPEAGEQLRALERRRAALAQLAETMPPDAATRRHFRFLDLRAG